MTVVTANTREFGRVAGLRVRVDGFLAAVRGTGDAARTPA